MTCSTMAWSRCCPSAWTSSNGESVNTAWCRQAGNSSSFPSAALSFFARTRRTISRAVTCSLFFFDVNAAYRVSGDLGVGDPAVQLVVPDGLRVPDRRPGVLGDRRDRGPDGGVHRHGDGEIRLVAADRSRSWRRCSTRSPSGRGSSRRSRLRRAAPIASAASPAAPRAEPALPPRSRTGPRTGAASGVLITEISGFRPLTSRFFPAIFACPNAAPSFCSRRPASASSRYRRTPGPRARAAAGVARERGQEPAVRLVQLPDVAPGIGAQVRPERGRGADPGEQRLHRAVPQEIHVVDAVRPAAMPPIRHATFGRRVRRRTARRAARPPADPAARRGRRGPSAGPGRRAEQVRVIEHGTRFTKAVRQSHLRGVLSNWR